VEIDRLYRGLFKGNILRIARMFSDGADHSVRGILRGMCVTYNPQKRWSRPLLDSNTTEGEGSEKSYYVYRDKNGWYSS